LATERLQYDVSHPRRQPYQALVVPEGAVLARLGQGCRVVDGPPLEYQVAAVLVGEYRRAVHAVGRRVDRDED
jgi:hypothetical protein